MINKAAKVIYNNTFREYLPRKVTVLNGVITRRNRLLDLEDIEPHYKHVLIKQIKRRVEEGDHVVDIGSGFGVATVTAAKSGAQVTSFEGGNEQASIVREAAELNGVAGRVTVHHAVVERNRDVYGEVSDHVVRANELPECDVLVLDCEGVEGDILDRLTFIPRHAIVEVHPWLGTSVDSIEAIFNDWGYSYELQRYSDSAPNPVIFGGR